MLIGVHSDQRGVMTDSGRPLQERGVVCVGWLVVGWLCCDHIRCASGTWGLKRSSKHYTTVQPETPHQHASPAAAARRRVRGNEESEALAK